MPRGRKPKPREQRIAEGNPGKRPLPEPVIMGGSPREAPEPPEHLDDDGKAWWREAVPILHHVGLLDTVDTAALEMAATAYSRFRQARRVVDAQGVLTRGSTGQLREHPALKTEREAQSQYLRFAEQYALTPVARTRLGLAELHRRSLADEMDSRIGEPELTPA
jgi:P27 family predicted phage terminase small subunit